MKLQLTTTAETELEVINDRIMSDESEYGELSERELLVSDAELYVEGSYEENEFDNLEEWCMLVGESEYNFEYLKKYPTVVFDKVTRMINEGILVVAK